MLKQIPNALTLARLVLAPVIAWAIWQAYNSTDEAAQGWTIWSAVLFIIAALTDLFDGMAARAFDAHSKFGRLIDPIADKALVGLPLIALSIVAAQTPWPFWWAIAASTTVIVLRDTTMTILRMTAKDGEGARVSSLAKIKTALELIVIGVLLVAVAAATQIAAEGWSDVLYPAWVALLVITAALSAYTAWQYLAPARKPAS
ncbi:MAG TPA: CDP-alcohol phosphatidyltransferase family protein [Hyphomonadaceae bacterium]|nr:CDP-alcohol phosphatidyltransferase family protein [Hyphomonadaceae bacterium]